MNKHGNRAHYIGTSKHTGRGPWMSTMVIICTILDLFFWGWLLSFNSMARQIRIEIEWNWIFMSPVSQLESGDYGDYWNRKLSLNMLKTGKLYLGEGSLSRATFLSGIRQGWGAKGGRGPSEATTMDLSMGLYPPKKSQFCQGKKRWFISWISWVPYFCTYIPSSWSSRSISLALLGTSRDHPSPEMTRNGMIFPLGHFWIDWLTQKNGLVLEILRFRCSKIPSPVFLRVSFSIGSHFELIMPFFLRNNRNQWVSHLISPL